MAKTQIKFKTVLSSLTKGGKPCYSVRVLNNGTEYLADSSQMKEIARLINMNVPFAKTTSEIVLEKSIELALTGKRVETEMFSMYLTVRGGFAKTTEKWNPAKHSLHLVTNLKGALKEKMADISVNGVNKGEFSFGGPKDGSLDGYVEIEDIPFSAGDTVKVTVHPDPEKTEYVQEDSSFTTTAE